MHLFSTWNNSLFVIFASGLSGGALNNTNPPPSLSLYLNAWKRFRIRQHTCYVNTSLLQLSSCFLAFLEFLWWWGPCTQHNGCQKPTSWQIAQFWYHDVTTAALERAHHLRIVLSEAEPAIFFHQILKIGILCFQTVQCSSAPFAFAFAFALAFAFAFAFAFALAFTFALQ